jgi:hypothetical protein
VQPWATGKQFCQRFLDLFLDARPNLLHLPALIPGAIKSYDEFELQGKSAKVSGVRESVIAKTNNTSLDRTLASRNTKSSIREMFCMKVIIVVLLASLALCDILRLCVFALNITPRLTQSRKAAKPERREAATELFGVQTPERFGSSWT